MKNWKKLLLDNFYPILLVGLILVFFYPVFIFRKIPIPADTIVGMYHPWRDEIWNGYKAGVPYKNFLITDPVRQQYVWRKLAIDELKKGRLPLWNPYSFSGTPLLANFQSAPFYPLNILYFLLPFDIAWAVQVISQPVLAGIFLYLYLRFIRVSKMGSFLGGFTFAFSGFSIAWLEWNTIVQTVLWLPLIILAKEHLLKRLTVRWLVILLFGEISAFFAGHLQILFYTLIVSNIYLLVRIIQLSANHKQKGNVFLVAVKKYLPFLLIGCGVLVITSVQWVPALQFILTSARDFDQGSWLKDGWFIPWQNLIQFLSPDFFGNPATGNYWGVWNYGEFIGYIGVIPLIFVVYSLIFRRDKQTFFFAVAALVSLVFALPTPLAKLPYQWKIPLLSTSQPTRLLFVVDFSLAVLAALGIDQALKNKNSALQIIKLMIFAAFIYAFLWVFVLRPSYFGSIVTPENLAVGKRNLLLPTLILAANVFIFLIMLIYKKRSTFTTILYSIVVIIITGELLRFGWKFTPFTSAGWLFPQTKILSILANNNDYYRIMSADGRIMPPNFSASYRLSDVAGYDPLYLKSYGQLVAAWGRNKPDISPAPFNRIVNPVNYESFITDLLGVKYIMNLTPLNSGKLDYSFKEGETYLYVNKKAFPKVFMVESVLMLNGQQEIIDKMFELGDKLRTTAVTEDNIKINSRKLDNDETAEIISYLPNQILIRANTKTERMLVLTDVYYPSWKAFINETQTKIYQVDFALRGILVPAGNHTIEFRNSLL